uniref:Uncharacterized protein n=1 Tax=Theropithecus gelada TaxID=9565 RepID=A0A8D2K5Q7_THEGE
ARALSLISNKDGSTQVWRNQEEVEEAEISSIFVIVCLCVPWTPPFQCKIPMVEFMVIGFCLCLFFIRTSELFVCGQPSPRSWSSLNDSSSPFCHQFLESSSCVDPPGNTAGSRMPSSNNFIK